MTNTRSMIMEKTPVGIRIKGMTRSARPGMHVLRGLRYVTPTRLSDMMLPPTVVKKSAQKVKLVLVKSSDNENHSDASSKKSSDDDENESTTISSTDDSTPWDTSVIDTNGGLHHPNIGVWCGLASQLLLLQHRITFQEIKFVHRDVGFLICVHQPQPWGLWLPVPTRTMTRVSVH